MFIWVPSIMRAIPFWFPIFIFWVFWDFVVFLDLEKFSSHAKSPPYKVLSCGPIFTKIGMNVHMNVLNYADHSILISNFYFSSFLSFRCIFGLRQFSSHMKLSPYPGLSCGPILTKIGMHVHLKAFYRVKASDLFSGFYFLIFLKF